MDSKQKTFRIDKVLYERMRVAATAEGSTVSDWLRSAALMELSRPTTALRLPWLVPVPSSTGNAKHYSVAEIPVPVKKTMNEYKDAYFCRNLTRIMEENGVTDEAVGKFTRRPLDIVKRLKDCDAKYYLFEVRRLAEFLGVTERELVGDEFPS